MIASNFFISILFMAASVSAQEPSVFESKMNQIYKSSYSKEVDDNVWGEYISSLNTRTYQVNEGDTLWGLSEVFFGDGFFWSKIWSYNNTLTNPHLLRVGQEIQFFTGSIEEAPGLSLAQSVQISNIPNKLNQNGDKTLISEPAPGQQPTQASGLYPGAPMIPPPRDAVLPVLTTLPGTFASDDGSNVTQYDEKGISMDVRPPVQVNPLFVAYSFLYGDYADKYPRVGEVVESENGNILAGLNEKIYLESKEQLNLGDTFTVMSEDYPFRRNGVKGSVIRYLAKVRVTEILKENKYRAEVYRSLSGIQSGAWISRENIPTFNDDHAGRPAEQKFPIIGGGHDNISRIYGQSDVVYLEGGSEKGLRVGDILGIYKTRDLRMRSPVIEQSPTPIGHIKVFRSEPKLASAFIVSSTEAILPGDITGEPTVVKGLTTDSEKSDLNNLEAGLDFDSSDSAVQSEDEKPETDVQ